MRSPIKFRVAGYRFLWSCCCFFLLILCTLPSCKKKGSVKSAFYYWKSSFSLNKQQSDILKQTAGNTLYLRFFDVSWNEGRQSAYPDAIISFAQPVAQLNIIPVIFISNKTFDNIKTTAIDSLAINTNTLLNNIANKASIHYNTLQFDCDWTLKTRDKYFNFLKAFKKINRHQLQATIRLHQIKYKELTGIPPVDKGVLMFYNMGKLNGNLQQPNSIYNEGDAAKYVAYTSKYPLLLDIALPLFSWSIHIREGRVIQLYDKLDVRVFNDPQNFDPIGNAYQAKKSFFMSGIYIKQNDIFKVEQTDVTALKKAAKQLSGYLPPQKNRTIIYYELGNLNLSEFKAETLLEVSADM